jgi:hypothetical protein
MAAQAVELRPRSLSALLILLLLLLLRLLRAR